MMVMKMVVNEFTCTCKKQDKRRQQPVDSTSMSVTRKVSVD